MADAPPITVKMQAWVYFVTWIQYAANHITRKCYTNVKNVSARGVPWFRGGFTSFRRVVARNDGRGWFLFRLWGRS